MIDKIKLVVRNYIQKYTGIPTALAYTPMPPGKHRSTCIDNKDPKNLNRIRVRLHAGGMLLPWATPCTPDIDELRTPKVGAGIWVEFEELNPAKPIWCGCFFEQDNFGSTNTPGINAHQKVTKGIVGGQIQDAAEGSIESFNEKSGNYDKEWGDGDRDQLITKNKTTIVKGNEEKNVMGTRISNVGGEFVRCIGRVFRRVILGRSYKEYAEGIYERLANLDLESFKHISGGLGRLSGMRMEVTTTGKKFILGANTPATPATEDIIPAPTITLEITDVVPGTYMVELKMFTDTVKIKYIAATQQMEITAYGNDIKINGLNDAVGTGPGVTVNGTKRIMVEEWLTKYYQPLLQGLATHFHPPNSPSVDLATAMGEQLINLTADLLPASGDILTQKLRGA